MDPHDYNAWRGSGIANTLRAFWSAVKSATTVRCGIKKVFITGITPLLLSDMNSGFNIAENISFDSNFATICGLTTDDVVAALKLLCKEDEEMVEEHLAKLQYYTNGYHFCNTKSVPKVFNTNTVMWYLQVMFLKQLVLKVEPSADKDKYVQKHGGETPNLANPPNSEFSENILMSCAGAPAAINDIQLALQNDGDGYRKLRYHEILENFKLEELVSRTYVGR